MSVIRYYLVVFLAIVGLLGWSSEDTPSLSTTANSIKLGMLSADFSEPFIPTTAGADDEILAQVLSRYQSDPRLKSQKVDLLETFLDEHPDDPWAPSIRVNLGLYYHQGGRFSRALKNLKQGWHDLKDSEDPRLKSLGEHSLGEYAQSLAHLGRIEDLEPLLESVKGRSFSGSSTELIAASREGLHMMKTSPDYSFWCGPAALKRIAKRQASWNEDTLDILKKCTSTSRGTSLLQNRDLSRKIGLNYQIAYRESDSEILTPAVVHWKAGHFGALFASDNEGFFSVEDDTAGLGREVTHMTPEALEEESSGYFLVRTGPLPSGWRPVSDEEGQKIWGRGYTGFQKQSGATGGDDSSVPGGPGDCPPESPGMTSWSAHTMLVSLSLKDTPVGLSPAAFSVPFTVTYSQREINQPSVFDYSNLGPKWTTNWTSFLTDDRTSTGQIVHYKSGGGSEEFRFATSGATVSEPGAFSLNVLEEIPDGFRLTSPDGSSQEFQTQIGTRYHLTKVVDPQGNTVTLEYDSSNRLNVIRDAVGREMTLSYELSGDPLKITKVTDPFGRSATFSYTADGHLESATDTIGLVSSYEYGQNDFIKFLTTPYGTTSFTYGDVNTNSSLGFKRYLEIVDTEGRKSRLESDDNVPQPILPAPQGMPLENYYLEYRNSFFWEPQQLDEIPVYAKATMYHFMHGVDNGYNLSRVLESVKKPLQNRVWYAYDRNAHPRIFTGAGRKLPTHIGRVLSDGSTQLTKHQYNDLGNVTQTTDPAGRVFVYTYDPNQIDLTSLSTGGQTLFLATYDNNHNIAFLTDASGGTSSFSYNTRGQITSATNALGETTEYSYTPTGNLSSIEAPLQKITTFSYDNAERLRSATDSEGYTALVDYDDLDRPLSITYPDGTTDTLTYSNLDLVATKDRLDHQTQMGHDLLRRLTSITDANGGVTQLTYGLEDSPNALIDPNGNTTGFAFDIQQRMIAKQYPGGAAQTVDYESCSGRVARVTDALGHSKSYKYFLDNQLKNIQYSGGTPSVSFANDTFLPRPLSMTDGQGTTAMSYGPVGSPGANKVTGISGPFGDEATMTYDIAGRLAVQNVNGLDQSVSFDPLWRPTSVTNALDTFTMTYLGKTGQMTSIGSIQGPSSQYSYASNVGDRRLIQIKNLRNNGGALSQFDYSHDAIGQIKQLVQTFGASDGGGGGGDDDDDDDDDDHCDQPCCHDGKCCHNHNCCKKKCCKGKGKCGKDRCKEKHGKGKGHGEDDWRHERKHAAWQINQVLENVWGWCLDDDDDNEPTPPPTTTGTSETLTFDYDNLSQLVGVNRNETPLATYDFDPAGNLQSLTINGTTTTFTHNSLNQPTSPEVNVFDPKGQTTDQEGRTFEWDDQGQVTAIVQSGQRSEFGYDGLGRRTKITELVDGVVVSKKLYWWLGGRIVCERDGLQPDFPITKRYFGQGVLQGTTKLFYTFDHLGSVRALLDAGGNVVADYRYSTYGERTKESGDLDSDFGYAGLFHHEASGLDLATYRLYDAKQRRWISRDPLGESVDYNLYRYANNNPINLRDPSGLDPCGGDDQWIPRDVWISKSKNSGPSHADPHQPNSGCAGATNCHTGSVGPDPNPTDGEKTIQPRLHNSSKLESRSN